MEVLARTSVPFWLALGTAFLYGILTFLSPCILPMVPGYISFLTAESGRSSRSSFFSALFFVLTFTLVFSLMGFGVGTISTFITVNSSYLRYVGGSLIIFFGLQMSGLLLKEFVPKIILFLALFLASLHLFGILGDCILPTIGLLLLVYALYVIGLHRLMYSEVRLKLHPEGVLKPVLLGLAFAIGWSPCLGPFLGTVLIQSSSFPPPQAALILFAYSIGLAIPFLVLASASSLLFSFVNKMSKYGLVMELVGGSLLILVGVAIFYGLV